MISRRNIRIKVMQTLYALESELGEAESEHVPVKKLTAQGHKMLQARFDNSADLFSVLLQFMVRIARYAETDAHLRASKYLPSEQDKNVNIKISGNTFIWTLLENESYKSRSEDTRLSRLVEEERVKKLYRNLTQSTIYREYIDAPSRDPNQEKEIIRYLWETIMLDDEDFLSYLNDEWVNWEDDRDMMRMLMENTFKAPAGLKLDRFVSEEKSEFARTLLQAVLDKGQYAMEYIQPRLNNWDVERVALIDLVVLKMGFCEFMYFPTIPTRVSLNEYIEIAKDYSTALSGQFVNGVLDSILRKLMEENKIRKVERSK